jgi:hypothetical protein
MAVSDSKGEFRFRHWIELLLGAVAVAVSAISLWVAIGTEQANRQMVAAASWPLLQADTSNLNSVITFSILNGGVGPAKVNNAEVLWNGKAYPGAVSLLQACCGYKPITGPYGQRGITTGGVSGIVIRAGEEHTFLSMPLRSDNGGVWKKLDRIRRQLKFRACYCSVFDECWIGTLADLEPQRVDKCAAVKTPYVE